MDVSYPGVYVQEVPSASQPIAAASTSRAVFVGDTEMGDENVARLITSWEDYQRQYGGFSPGPAYVAHAVFQFLNNGGRSFYVLRTVGPGGGTARVPLPTAGANAVNTLEISARSSGVWGNSLFVSVSAGELDPNNEIAITVRRLAGTDPSKISQETPVEVHDNLSLDPASERYLPNVLKAVSRYVVGTISSTAPALTTAQLIGAELPSSQPTTAGSFRIRANGTLHTVAVAAQTAQETLVERINTGLLVLPASARPTAALETTGTVSRLKFSLEPTAAAVPSLEVLPLTTEALRNTAFVTKLGFWPQDNPTFFSPYRSRIPATTASPVPLTLGSDSSGLPVFATNTAAKSALNRITDASLLLLPGQADEYSDAVGYCENRPLRDMFFIGDCEKTVATTDTSDELTNLQTSVGGLKKNGMGALYFPWVLTRDPKGGSVPITIPPSGFVAGIYARTDRDRGVWKAPAGIEAQLTGAVGLTHYITDEEQGTLNLKGINVLRRFDAAGLVVWGARTLSSNSSQRYVPVRRVQSMIQRSVYDGLQGAVFQPNSHLLWAALKTDVGAFMNGLFRAGAFQGETARQAFFVRCGLGETMTQTDIDLGMVIVEVGFAPLKPAEFVIVRVQHIVSPT